MAFVNHKFLSVYCQWFNLSAWGPNIFLKNFLSVKC